jgi:hypothetical protein
MLPGAALRALQLDPGPGAAAQTGSDEETPQPQSHLSPASGEQVTG